MANQTFTYALGPQASVKTTVSGANLDIALVQIFNVNTQVFSVTVMSPSNAATLPAIGLGAFSIVKGSTLNLQVASSVQQGQVVLNGTIQSGTNDPQPIAAAVATWNLTTTP